MQKSLEIIKALDTLSPFMTESEKDSLMSKLGVTKEEIEQRMKGIYKENDTIKIKITFSGVNSFLEELFKNVELTFNDTEVCDEKLKLDIILVDDTISWLLGTENAYSICFVLLYCACN